MSITDDQLKQIIEAALMAADQPLSVDRIHMLFSEEKEPPDKDQIREALKSIQAGCETRGVELKKVSSGYRFQAKQDYANWVSRLWEEKPARYSRALLETLVLVAYKQPITRGEIEHVRGVAVSTHIIKTLLERDWVKVVGHRDVPGKPALYATTKTFLDYFNLTSLEELPTLQEIRDLDKINEELELVDPGVEQPDGNASLITGADELSAVENAEPDSGDSAPLDETETDDDAISAEGEAELEDKNEDPEIHDREPVMDSELDEIENHLPQEQYQEADEEYVEPDHTETGIIDVEINDDADEDKNVEQLVADISDDDPDAEYENMDTQLGSWK